MDAAVSDEGVALVYRPRYREYGIRICESALGMVRQCRVGPVDEAIRMMEILDCPWCGDALPGSVRDQWRDLIFNKYEVKSLWSETETFDQVPAKMLDETWWREVEIGFTNTDSNLTFDQVSDEIVNSCRSTPKGLEKPLGRSPHHCEAMMASLEDCRELTQYRPWTREYGIRIIDMNRSVHLQYNHRIKPIRYCPWCGDALPQSLRLEWEARVRDLGLDPDVPCTPYPEGLPDDLISDTWWREAGNKIAAPLP